MSIDNLPGELPRDASLAFGNMLMSNVLHDLLTESSSAMIERATILRNGKLTDRYNYLDEYLNRL
jgi:saccharopine dehydrogenase (NAD+, L-lysine forming)